jgi:sugar O-acyltransferase (sialic acid O-acetyltransferase NeuD family)
VRWYVEDRAQVAAGEPLVEIETSKAILDVDAPDRGVLLRLCPQGEQRKVDEPLAYLFDSVESLERFEQEPEESQPHTDAHAGRITAPARRRAEELGLDIELIAQATEGLVTTKVVEAAALQSGDDIGQDLPDPLDAPPGVRRLVLLGAGFASNQIIDILVHDPEQQAIAIVDDDRARFGEVIDGVPVVGGVDRALALFSDGKVDAAVIAVGTSVAARTRLRQRCEEAGLPLANVIDPSVRICSDVKMGTGNVICAHCHFGVGTIVGDNNLISANSSFDHHSELGSDITTGPGCVTSGLVKIGDRCRFGMGVCIEPYVSIGAGTQVSSGAVIVSSIPAEHAVKTRVVTTTVVPLRGD